MGDPRKALTKQSGLEKEYGPQDLYAVSWSHLRSVAWRSDNPALQLVGLS